jgi:hypothetical protein
MGSLSSQVPCGHYHWSSSGRGLRLNGVHIRTTFLESSVDPKTALSPPMDGPTEELPNYSPNPGHPRASTGGVRSEHRYALQDKNGRDWLSFKVKSRAADSKHMPLFLEGDIIKGEVCLDLARAETLKGLTITVRPRRGQLARCPHARYHQIRAGTTAVGQEEELFLHKTEPIWTPASPREAKLVGAHTHAFSISIPRDAMVAPVPKATTPKRFSLPPTFSERASPVYIDYKLYVTVRRRGLRVNDKCVFLITATFDVLHVGLAAVVRTGCQLASPSSHARWPNHRPSCVLLYMLRAGGYLVQMRIPRAGKCSILSRSRARSSMRAM